MTVAISTINIGTSANDGTGDNLRAAFTKVNSSLGNIKIGVDNLQATYANTAYSKVANLTVTNRVIGSLNLYGTDTIYINGSPVATSAALFSGGDVPLQANFNAVISSTSSSTGAVVITAGGLGVNENLNVGGNVVVESITDSSGISSGAVVVKGGMGIEKTVYVGGGLYVDWPAYFAQTINSTGDALLNSTTTSINPSTGALRVAGGVGIVGNLNTGANAKVASDMYIGGNLYVTGSTTTGAENLSIQDNIIELHTFANLAPLTLDDGKDIGIKFHYYKAGMGDKFAFAGWANDTGAFEYYSNGSESGGIFTGDYGTFKGGDYLSMNNTPATSTTTGAVRTAGGIGAQGNLYVGGTVNAPIIGNLGAILTGTLNTAAQTNITSVGTLSGLTVGGDIVPNANLTVNIGSTGAWFNTFYGVSTQAKYADLAEHYAADADYAPGTVVVFGGEKEVTVTNQHGDVSVAGVISTNPAYLMNAQAEGLPVALRGRVPVRVIGQVTKGDLLVTAGAASTDDAGATPGCAISVGRNGEYGIAIFAKALESKDTAGEGIIEAVII